MEIRIEGDSIEILPYHPNNSEELNVVYIPTNREISKLADNIRKLQNSELLSIYRSGSFVITQ